MLRALLHCCLRFWRRVCACFGAAAVSVIGDAAAAAAAATTATTTTIPAAAAAAAAATAAATAMTTNACACRRCFQSRVRVLNGSADVLPVC